MKLRLNPSYTFLILSIIFQSISSVLSKFAATDLKSGSFLLVIINSYYLLSIISLLLQAMFWQLALRELDLSIAYPLTALNNVFILVFSYLIFNEHVTFNNILGVLIILSGILVQSVKWESK